MNRHQCVEGSSFLRYYLSRNPVPVVEKVIRQQGSKNEGSMLCGCSSSMHKEGWFLLSELCFIVKKGTLFRCIRTEQFTALDSALYKQRATARRPLCVSNVLENSGPIRSSDFRITRNSSWTPNVVSCYALLPDNVNLRLSPRVPTGHAHGPCKVFHRPLVTPSSVPT